MEKELRQKILEYLQTIPKQKVSTYKNIGNLFSIHPRWVGRIMATNKFPEIYPCYKVVASDWKLNWYSTDRGLEEKKEKLEKDWIEIFNWRVLKKYIL